jgi:Transposase, Mutator family
MMALTQEEHHSIKQQIVLLAVTFDGNNQLVILAYAVVSAENADNWVWFKERLDSDFPKFYNVWMSDANKGITSEAFSFSMSQSDDSEDFVLSRCAWHLAENCKENCKSCSMNEEHKNMIIDLAKARIEEDYQQHLDSIRQANNAWADWLDKRKWEFANASFLERGIWRFGKVTSNSVENINSSLVDIHGYPIAYMLEAINKYQREHYLKRQIQAAEWTKLQVIYYRPYQGERST